MSSISESITFNLEDKKIAYKNIRDVTCINLYNFLTDYDIFMNKQPSDQNKIILFVENECYNKMFKNANKLKFVCVNNAQTENLYNDIVHNVLEYIDKDSDICSEDFVSLLMTDHKQCSKILAKTYISFNEKIWKSYVEDHESKLDIKVKLKYSERYKHCKQYKCTTQDIQCRSADEGSDIIVSCTVCGFSWKGG